MGHRDWVAWWRHGWPFTGFWTASNPCCLLHQSCSWSVSRRNPQVSSPGYCSHWRAKQERCHEGLQFVGAEVQDAQGKNRLSRGEWSLGCTVFPFLGVSYRACTAFVIDARRRKVTSSKHLRASKSTLPRHAHGLVKSNELKNTQSTTSYEVKFELSFTYKAVFSGEISVNDKAEILLTKLYFVGFNDLFPLILSGGRL